MPEIASGSIVDPKARLADDVVVGPYCLIGPGVSIGPGCIIENNVTIVGHTTLGGQNHIFPMAVIGTTSKGDDMGGVCVIGNANSIREHVTIYAGNPDNPTTIGRDNLIMIASQIGQEVQIGDHGIFANCTCIGPGAIIEDYVRTSAFSFVDQNITLGAYSFTAGYTHVDADAPPFAMLQGSPYRIRGANSHNLKACGFDEEDIRSIKRAFRDLYNGTSEIKVDILEEMKKDKTLNVYVRSLVKSLTGTIARKG